MISVRPDPAHPMGGYALLSMPADQLPDGQTQVAVFDNYSERYLGEAGWQPTKALFGPYDVRHEGGQAQVVIGPEIVNQIEEYANIRLLVGPLEQDIGWPDDVVPAPGAARIGGIMASSVVQNAPKSGLSAQIPTKTPDPVPSPDPQSQAGPAETPEPDFDVEEDDDAPGARGKGGMILSLLVMVLAAAGLAYWLLNADGTPPAQPVAVATPQPEGPGPCSTEALSSLQGFNAQAQALRTCGAEASADAALGLVERAAAGGDPAALLLFGTVYDGAQTDAAIEDTIGLTFGDVPATAAEYYARAVAAGSDEARDMLALLCERMAGMTDTLVQGAVADHCGN